MKDKLYKEVQVESGGILTLLLVVIFCLLGFSF